MPRAGRRFKYQALPANIDKESDAHYDTTIKSVRGGDCALLVGQDDLRWRGPTLYHAPAADPGQQGRRPG